MWKPLGQIVVTTFLVSFLDHIGKRAAEHLWPDPEDYEEDFDERKAKKRKKKKKAAKKKKKAAKKKDIEKEPMSALTPCPSVRSCTLCNHEEPIPDDLDWCHVCVETVDDPNPNAGMSEAWRNNKT